MELAGAQAEGRLFHGSVNSLQHGPDDQIGDGKEGDDLDEDQAVESVNVISPRAWPNAQNLARDEAIATEEQDRGDGNGKGRGNGRQQRDDVKEAGIGNRAAHQRIGENEAQNRAARGRTDAHDHGVEHNLPGMGPIDGIDVLPEIFQTEFTGLGIEETLPDDAHQRQSHKQKDEGADQNKPRAEDGILADQTEFLPALPKRRAPFSVDSG